VLGAEVSQSCVTFGGVCRLPVVWIGVGLSESVDCVGGIESVSGTHVNIAFEQHGDVGCWPVVLLHGFPYDPRCYDHVAEELHAVGARVVVPYLRGYGLSRYADPDTTRSGQQAALASDLRDLISGLGLDRPIVAGFDWGGRAACVASMLWPEIVGGLVTVAGYNVHDVAAMSITPEEPAVESRNWYQWYLHSERGRRGLERYRAQLARQLWSEWSPTWRIPTGAFERTAPSFDNPDFVATVVHSYRHRYGLATGDPRHEADEAIIATKPLITVPTIVLDATADPLDGSQAAEAHRRHFSHLIEHHTVEAGHNMPQENPGAFAAAVEELHVTLTT
jgi:pimeloyl-ACP methyl ester carboxylesterase